MLKEAQNLSASCLDKNAYKDVGTIQLAVEKIAEAVKAASGQNYYLQEDKSGELMLCENNQHSIRPLLYMAANCEIKHYLPKDDFHKQYANVSQILEDGDRVKLPVMDTTASICPPMPA